MKHFETMDYVMLSVTAILLALVVVVAVKLIFFTDNYSDKFPEIVFIQDKQ